MPEPSDLPTLTPSDLELVTRRRLSAPREAAWDALRDPTRLARWWGPQGFTSTFHEFDLRPGGNWRFVMHGPTGTDYDNDSRFLEIEPPERLVIHHLSPPEFVMTLTLTEEDGDTWIEWRMCFPAARKPDELRRYVEPANEENLDRLEAELARSG